MGQRSEWREPIATPIPPTEQGHTARFVPGEGLMDCLRFPLHNFFAFMKKTNKEPSRR